MRTFPLPLLFISVSPFSGIILSHSNQSEWANFRNNKTNEAFLDRVCVIKVPYCLRVNEEEQIYQKMLKGSTMRNAPIAPQTLKMLAQFMVLTRLVEPSNSTMNAKMRVYNGEAVKDTMPNAKPIEEYRMAAGVEEGMSGMSTRFAFKIISKCLDLRPDERQANPVDLMFVLEEAIRLEHLPEETAKRYNYFIREYLHRDYFTFLEKELRAAYLDSSDTFGQNMFERYVLFAEAWLDDTQCRDPETHVLLNRSQLNEQLEAIERPASVMNVKDFRHEIVNYVLRYRAKNGGNAPRWSEYTKIKDVIEKKMFAATENIMPVISFGPKSSDELATKHNKFIERMVERGYTENQIQLLVAWWTANAKT
jgi:serine protein kinase